MIWQLSSTLLIKLKQQAAQFDMLITGLLYLTIVWFAWFRKDFINVNDKTFGAFI